MGYGFGPYGIGSLGIPGPPTLSENPSDLSSSRRIDGVTKRYVLNAQGGFESMDDIDQRVLLLVAFARPQAKFITSQDMAAQEASIRSALEPLTKGRDPAIRILGIKVERSGSQQVTKSVRYTNLRKNTEQTVKAS